ncbi:MAG: hypothetical protein JRJ31_17915 [Deltaproteobacteria bacterium]|nr:hypothetical protein [Deltaproteobacteria bacterium]
MDEEEFNFKYTNLRILKSAQEYLKSVEESPTALYPIKVPDDLLYQLVRMHGVEKTDRIIHHIFELGLSLWSEKVYREAFGSNKDLERFIEMVKRRMKD